METLPRSGIPPIVNKWAGKIQNSKFKNQGLSNPFIYGAPENNKFYSYFFLLFLPYYLIRELSYLDKAYFFCPIEYKQDTVIIRHDSYGSGDFMAERSGPRKHNGIDLQAKIGAPVFAVRGGKVIEARFSRGMGNYVELSHSGGYTTIYGHLSKIAARQGQAVRQGG